MVKKIKTLQSIENDFSHSPFEPYDVLKGEEVTAQVYKDGDWENVKVWRYSPFGIEIVLDSRFNLSKGDRLDLKVNLGISNATFKGVVVESVFEEKNVSIAGIRMFTKPPKYESSEDRRKHQRWSCAKEFLPTGTSPNPSKFNDYILFRIEDVSASGFKFITSMRNKLLAVGQRLDASISIPMVGSVKCSFIIRYIGTKYIDSKEYIHAGAQLLTPDEITIASIGEYLLNFAEDITVNSLRKEGLKIKEPSKWLDFSYVKNQNDLDQVKALRHAAYKNAGKLSEDLTEDDMTDIYDSRSRILMVKHRGAVIGTSRLVFDNDYNETELYQYLKNPQVLPKISDCVGVTRLCIDENYRGSDVFTKIIAHCVLTTVKSGRRYIYAGAYGPLLPFYGQTGLKKTGVKYANKALHNLEHELILMDTYNVALGRDIKPKQWKRVFSSLVNYMIDQEMVFPSKLDEIRLNIYRFLGGSL